MFETSPIPARRPESGNRIASLRRLAMVRRSATRRMSMRRLLLPFALLSAFALAACTTIASDDVAPVTVAEAAAAPAASGISPVAKLVRQVDIPYEQFTLDNGLKVIVHEDRKAPVVAVSIWYNVGSKD